MKILALASLVLLAGAPFMSAENPGHLGTVEVATRAAVGMQFYSCVDSDLYTGVIPQDVSTFTDRISDSLLWKGSRFYINEAKFVPYAGADKGYKLYLGLIEDDSKAAFHGQVYLPSLDVTEAELNDTITQGLKLTHAPGGRSFPGVGMTSSALFCRYGSPEKWNDYGQGDEQLIYSGGRVIVYIDGKTDRVSNVQQFSN